MKKILKSQLLLFICMICSLTVNAALPDVHIRDKFTFAEGLTAKVAYTDPFTTVLNGESIRMRMIFTKIQGAHALGFEILSTNSNLYKQFQNYVLTLDPVLDKFKYTGRRICDIYLHENNFWMMATKYALAGSSLGLVRMTFDEISKDQEKCIAITFPLSFMDSNRYNWSGNNHYKDLLKALMSGECQDIEYSFINPVTKKNVSVTLPLNSEIALVIKKLVETYK